MDGGITVLNVDENTIIVKSNKLIEAIYENFLTIREQKLILKVCSLIKRDDEEFTTYTISIKAFSEMMELKGNPKYNEYQKITEKLLSKVISIKEENGLLQTHWFSKVRYNYGEGTIDFSFPLELKPYLLKLQENFTPLDLNYILKLNSTHSIRFYELMRSLSFRHTALIDLKDLKKMLGVENSYKEYSNFKLRILNPSMKEINNKTDIFFEYEEIKKSRKVITIRFFIKLKRIKESEKPKSIEQKNGYVNIMKVLEENDISITKNILNKWVESSKEIFGETTFEDELKKIIKDSLKNKSIENPIGFITYILKEKKEYKETGKDHNLITLSSANIREEIVPSWLKEQKDKKDKMDITIDSVEDKQSINERREKLKREIAEMTKH